MPVKGSDCQIQINARSTQSIAPTARFLSHVRETPHSPNLLAECSTDAGTITHGTSVLQGDGNYLTTLWATIPGLASKTFPHNVVLTVMDVVRVDGPSPVNLGFRLRIPWSESVTRVA